jgi:hypothetical protein
MWFGSQVYSSLINRSNAAAGGEWVPNFAVTGPNLGQIGLQFHTLDDAKAKGRELAGSGSCVALVRGQGGLRRARRKLSGIKLNRYPAIQYACGHSPVSFGRRAV